LATIGGCGLRLASAAGLILCVALPAAGEERAAAASAAWAPAPPPAGAYTLDPSHASLLFRIDHLGFSHYTARFRHFEAALQFDPAHPERASVRASVDVRSLETDFPEPAKIDFNAMLLGEQWLDAAQFPLMRFHSTSVDAMDGNRLHIRGELELRGVTRPMLLEATYNGGYAGHPMDPRARIGFSAHGTLKRSEFGIVAGIPPPGSHMGVGDEVEVIIEAEFSGPPLK